MQGQIKSKTIAAPIVRPRIRGSFARRGKSVWGAIAFSLLGVAVALFPISPARGEGLHVVVETEGWAVKIEKEGIIPLWAGDRLSIDDEIYVFEGTQFTILCDNEYVWEVDFGYWKVSQGCPDTGDMRNGGGWAGACAPGTLPIDNVCCPEEPK